MKRISLICYLLLLVHSFVSGQEILIEKGIKAGDLWCYPSLQNSNHYYYLPSRTVLATDQAGRPKFVLQSEAIPTSDRDMQTAKEVSLILEFSLQSSESEIRIAEKVLKDSLGAEIELLGSIKLNHEDFLVLGEIPEIGDSKEEILLLSNGKISRLNGQNFSISFTLKNEEASLFRTFLNSANSSLDLSLDFSFQGLTTTYGTKVELRWDRVPKSLAMFRPFEDGRNILTATEIDEFVNKMISDGSIGITIIGEDITHVFMISLREKIQKLLFEPANLSDLAQPVRKTVLSSELIELKKRITDNARPDGRILNRYYRPKKFKTGNYVLSFKGRSEIKLNQIYTLNLTDTYQKYKDDHKLVREINLNDPTFRNREVLVDLDVNLEEAFEEVLNGINLIFQKQYPNGQAKYDEYAIHLGNVMNRERPISFSYTDNGSTDPSNWMDYQYRVIWNFKGGSSYDTDWVSSQTGMINLAPPYKKQLIEFEGDLKELGRQGVKIIQASISYPFFDQEKIIKHRIRPTDELRNTHLSVFLPKHVKAVQYQLTWLFDKGDRVELSAVDDLGFIFLDKLPASAPVTGSLGTKEDLLPEEIRDVRAGVVRISSGIDSGTGFVVGIDDESLYLLTAAHVIENPGDINLNFYSGQKLKATVVRMHEGFDVAALKCQIPTNFSTTVAFEERTTPLNPQLETRIVGHPLGNLWDINYESRIKALEYDLQSDLFTLSPQGIAPGNSGSPILDKDMRILGLVTQKDPVKAVAVRWKFLKKACLSWNVPVNMIQENN